MKRILFDEPCSLGLGLPFWLLCLYSHKTIYQFPNKICTRSGVCNAGKQPLFSNQKEQILGKIHEKIIFCKIFCWANSTAPPWKPLFSYIRRTINKRWSSSSTPERVPKYNPNKHKNLKAWWNPAVEDQASDRAHRMGQQKPITIYRLIMQNSIEEKILELHKNKREMAAEILEGSDTPSKMSEEDLLNLISAELSWTNCMLSLQIVEF